MTDIQKLLQNNMQWSTQTTAKNPNFFSSLVAQQTPKYLWIGCSDSRVPANEIVGLASGELFVHRNIANLVIHTDLNALSVIQYAVDVLKVEHIIICGHYNCGGVNAALSGREYGLIDQWLRHIKVTAKKYQIELNAIHDPIKKADRLSEINVIEQVNNVAESNILHNAWKNGQKIAVHGWIYNLNDGIIHDLGVTQDGLNDTNL
jgi:carbonic anhydrase